MKNIKLHATAKYAWWWKFYCYGLVITAWLTGMPPNLERVEYWAQRALTIKFVGSKRR